MTTLQEIMRANKYFVEHLPQEYICWPDAEIICEESKYPARQLALYTCMDTRLVDFLEPALGIERGHAKVIKAAGNTISAPFDTVIRSLLVAIYELDVEEIFVVGHEDCGMAHSSSESLIAKMLARGVHYSAIKMIEKELEDWVDHFHHPLQNVELAVAMIRANPLIPKDVPIHGLMFDPRSGKVEVIVNGYEDVEKQ